MTTNLLYHCSVDTFLWLSSKAKEEWKIHNFDHGWWDILKHSWHSKLPLIAKVFIWRVLIGGLLLGLALKLRCRGNPRGCVEVGQDHGGLEPRNQECEGGRGACELRKP